MIVFANAADAGQPLCTGAPACDGVTVVVTKQDVQPALEALYGPDTESSQNPPQSATWQATISTKTFNTLAAVLTAVLLAVVAIAVAWLRLSRRLAPPRRIAPPAAAPPRPIERPGPGQAVARSHVSVDGGYVELGEIVVWAVLSPHLRAVAAPGNVLDVLDTDDKNAVLTIAPALAGAQRGPTP
ncbi:hypothetical protein LWP59_27750 [Amycolatopsis acidiphila]|uniref:Uncharacterized protein n=1 Tax=Amycolatopsis acidiphila TaxID=715473 RepID=A0A557ZWR5_9PSEU|nr:hypothetical protein [Amycolatopsis acidiphila]TVT16457.1 hypothetical protein FNH06_34680 [Amycolatopsis acidiphila]UIJ57908.1 hypothetical protein LWP59_27750 [Amycolatopsis acidiphila]